MMNLLSLLNWDSVAYGVAFLTPVVGAVYAVGFKSFAGCFKSDKSPRTYAFNFDGAVLSFYQN